MAMPALKLKFEEVSVEERLARIESNVENIQTSVAEMRVDIRRLNDKIDGMDQRIYNVEQKLSAKIDAVDQKQCAKFDGLKDAIAALQLSQEKAISKLTLWAVTLYIGLAVTLLTVIVRSLHWP